MGAHFRKVPMAAGRRRGARGGPALWGLALALSRAVAFPGRAAGGLSRGLSHAVCCPDACSPRAHCLYPGAALHMVQSHFSPAGTVWLRSKPEALRGGGGVGVGGKEQGRPRRRRGVPRSHEQCLLPKSTTRPLVPTSGFWP